MSDEKGSKDKLSAHIYVSFNRHWLRGFLDRKNDSISKFRRILEKQLRASVVGISNIPTYVQVATEAHPNEYQRFFVWAYMGWDKKEPKGANLSKLQRVAKKATNDLLDSYRTGC